MNIGTKRQPSNASTASTAYSNSSSANELSRTSTFSSTGSSGYGTHKRGLSEAAGMYSSSENRNGMGSIESSPDSAYKSVRNSLRPLPQAPGQTPPERDKSPFQHGRGQSVDVIKNNLLQHNRGQSVDVTTTPSRPQHNRGKSIDVSKLATTFEPPAESSISPSRSPTRRPAIRPNSMLLSRSDSVSVGAGTLARSHGPPHLHSPLTRPELQSFERSSTSQLRTLSKFAQTATPDDFTITSPEQEVAGLHGRRRLQRSAVSRDKNVALSRTTGYSWEGRNWMDKQRQFLQAYEYLCHIGEAKEWMEDILQRSIPPAVQLEEALRDGVTLAEVVEALYPDRRIRIFRHPKLQARHWDNIAQFFRFLDDIQLPELFRFELIDLYEKKNIPKVIYCIHALSWLLFRKGVVDFRIGNLVGQLEFEDHELEEMQKGLDKAGVSMPSFGNMGADFGVEPAPEPEPVETEEERIDRELGEQEAMIIELQAQIRGAAKRMDLGRTMQVLWDTEDWLIDLQSMIRGDFTRQIVEYRLNMRRFAIDLQRHARGFLVRQRQSSRETFWKSREGDVLKLQNLIRAKKARDEVCMLRSELQQSEFLVKEFQSNIRGFLARKHMVAQEKETQAMTGPVLNLQAAVRGMLLRKNIGDDQEDLYREEPNITALQAVARALLTRNQVSRQQKSLHVSGPVWEKLQAVFRGSLLRDEVSVQKEALQACTPVWEQLQAFARASLLRDEIACQQEALHACTPAWEKLQAFARASLLRDELTRQEEALQACTPVWVQLQSFARANLLRDEIARQQEALHACTPVWEKLQAISRAGLLRGEITATKEALESHSPEVAQLQAFIRAEAVRRDVTETLSGLEAEESSIVELQSLIRGMLLRQDVSDDYSDLVDETPQITALQSMARGVLERQKIEILLDELQAHEEEITNLQALSRAVLLRNDIETVLGELDAEEDSIVAIQAAAKASLVRAKYAEKQRFFKENMEKVVKIQSFVRGRLQGEAYKSLTTGKNPPVNTVKNFVHLLNDSDFDFNEEIEFERMRKTVVQQVRQNEMAEQYIDQLDIKIALLVKNKITLDEVVKHQRNFGGHSGNLLINSSMASGNQFDLKALNKNSRKKLESYQQLFFNLQTQPQYLARLFQKIREQGMAEKDCKRVETLMMGLFGYAQKRREEYYLLKLIARSAREEIEHFHSINDFIRGNFFWTKLLANYTRSPRDRKFLRDLLGPLIMENIIEDPALDLESDPMQIYRSAIMNEELRTGTPSQRPLDIPRDMAIRDTETRNMFIDHLRDLREISDQFMLALESVLHKMPYGVRFICHEIYDALCQQFPHESQADVLQVVGSWIWKFYLQPALINPETSGVVEMQLTPLQKRNLGEVAKVVGQISSGRLFGGENMFLQPLNAYVGNTLQRMSDIFANIISVPDAESTFDIDEFNDLYARTKPTLYIKMTDIFAIHNLISTDLPHICPNRDDVLREIIQELGSAKNNESEMMGVSSTEISMTLTPKLHDIEDPEAEVKALFMETKRCILYIIRVQSGTNLMDILVRPITPEDDQKWFDLVREEFSADSTTRGAYSDANTLADIKSMSYWELKRTALENIMRLEQLGRISRQNYYQDILNAIAVDIRTKSRRRVQRQRELEGVRLTLGNLHEKAEWLESQRKSYDNYIEQAMMTLQKKGKKRFLMPFSKQYNHEKELERSGRTYKFGSFKYSARTLQDKGVLVAWKGYPEREWEKINLTISCDQVGVFTIEGSKGSMVITGAMAQVPMDSLLAAQFANHQYMDLFEGQMRLNVNLFLHLLYKKFYRTE
ncbi:GTPase-activator for Ras-like GTPase protein [Rutstroemia sp. NJR-2017a BVV2]|nr:GTPase-activator for Ras-like GTPase protein [Rutstroemia sp. NJR-2017a BVV2]